PNLFNLSPHKEFTWALTSPNYTSTLNSALQDIRSKIETDKYYCIYFHDYFIRSGYENGIVLNWISDLLDSVKNIYGTRLEFKTVSQAAQYFKNQLTINDEQLTNFNFSYALNQNYPNPFNSSTVITYQVAKETNQQSAFSLVTIKVYDLLGREIRTLVDDYRQPGEYQVTFDGSSLHSGLYLLQMRAGSFSSTKKMLLTK
ncbi:MAG: T9SS type A sorting domain-containing protein, partial [Ignavibacteria bacterium]|nr:T9SS type A sorting domain-containing protein [Ignavibacteria bacterium]